MVDFMDDKQLLGELKRGNNAAFEFLFKSHYPRLRGYAIRFIEDEEVAYLFKKAKFIVYPYRSATMSGQPKVYRPLNHHLQTSYFLLLIVLCLHFTYFSSFFYGPQWMSKLSEASLDC